MKIVAAAALIGVIAWASFIYAAINTLCDDDYWPDWT
jgi:hypothetical protein